MSSFHFVSKEAERVYWQGANLLALCGRSLTDGEWAHYTGDTATFIKASNQKCGVCENHPDMALTALAELP